MKHINKFPLVLLVLFGYFCAVGCEEYPGYNTENGPLRRPDSRSVSGTIISIDHIRYTAEILCNTERNIATRGTAIYAKDQTGATEERERVVVLKLRFEDDEDPQGTLYSGANSLQEYRERLLTLSSRINSDCVLFANDRQYPGVVSTLENTAGITPYIDVLIAFDLPTAELTLTDERPVLVYSDHAFGNGMIRFELEPQSLQNCD